MIDTDVFEKNFDYRLLAAEYDALKVRLYNAELKLARYEEKYGKLPEGNA